VAINQGVANFMCIGENGNNVIPGPQPERGKSFKNILKAPKAFSVLCKTTVAIILPLPKISAGCALRHAVAYFI